MNTHIFCNRMLPSGSMNWFFWDKTVRYRVNSYILDNLLTRFFIESVDRFLKMIGRINKEDCAINLRYQTSIFVWRQKTHNSEDFFVGKKNFQIFFSPKCVFSSETSRKLKKNWPKKFSLKFWKILRNFFYKSDSIPLMNFQNFCCWSGKFSHVRQKWTFYDSNWFRNPPCQFYLSFLKIDSRFLWKNARAKCPVYKKSPCIVTCGTIPTTS